jgi:hypothetical protein
MWRNSEKIQDFETSEDIWNNSVYVIDRSTQKIKIPKSVEDWTRCETVLVYNVPEYNNQDRFLIKAGTMCRCWRIWIQF